MRSLPRAAVVAVAAALAVAAVLFLVADVIAKGEAAGHVRYHAIFAGVVGVVALALAGRSARRGATSWAALGLLALVAAQLVESLGGAGYDADNDARNSFAVVHDLGLTLTLPGLLASLAGLAAGSWRTLRAPLGDRRAAIAAGASTLVAALLVKTLVGM